jgi:hypothetical protein
MSKRTDEQDRSVAIAVAKLRQSGHTNKEIARIQQIDVKRVPALARLGLTLISIWSR